MMARLFSLFLLITCSLCAVAQKTDTSFRKEWLDIDTLIVKSGLTKTALSKVNALYQRAKQKHLPAQMVKTLIYRYTLEDQITDNNPNLAVNVIKKEIAESADDIQRSILYSLLAKQYRRYYNEHRWNLYNRNNTIKDNKDDIATWSADDFFQAINKVYASSLSYKTKLQQQKIETYEAVLSNGDGRVRRPSLYDLLMHEALDYYKSGDINNTKPIQLFSITDSKALGNADVFIRLAFPTKDSSQNGWRFNCTSSYWRRIAMMQTRTHSLRLI
jgi:hypothetical protein